MLGNLFFPECPPLNTTNGDWTFNSFKRVPGVVATLTCHLNNSPADGSPITVCQKTHKWMPNPAKRCVECKKCTPFPKSGQNAQITYSEKAIEDDETEKEFYRIGSIATLICANHTGVSENVADISVCTPKGWIPEHFGQCERRKKNISKCAI